jgi:hypothetical protein
VHFRLILGLVPIVLGLLLLNSPAFSACKPGYVPTHDGACMPNGAVDCGHGRGYCTPGKTCKSDRGCLDAGEVDCGPGQGSCSPGQKCKSDGGCVDVGNVERENLSRQW